MELPVLNFNRPDGRNLEFELIEILNANLLNAPIEVHRHAFYEILFVEKFSSMQIVDFKNYTVLENEILIIPKNSVHNTSEKEKYKGQWLLFTDQFFNQEQSKVLNLLSIFNPIIENKLLKYDEKNEINRYIDLLKIEYSKEANNFLVLQNLLYTFLLKLENIAQEQYLTSKIDKVQDTYYLFTQLLEQYFKIEHRVSFYAKQLNITPKKTNSILVEVIGKTVSELIAERIMIEAKRLLIYSSKSVKEIAFELGFEDNHYFSRTFKNHTLLSPEYFRIAIAEKSIKKE